MSLTTLKKGVRIVAGEREKLKTIVAEKYRQGLSVRALSDVTGRSYGFIHRLLTEAEVQFRSRGGRNRQGTRRD